jgi:thiol-disulfide isomerase/thioredoxin
MKLAKIQWYSLLSAAMLLAVPGMVTSTENTQLAPSFEVQSLVGDAKINLADFQGKVVYVDFWASWCGPCLKSFPFMEQMHRQHVADGLVIVAINMDQDAQDAQEFIAGHPVSFLVGQDAAGSVAEQYGVIAMPSSFVVDRDGFIKDTHHGFKASDKEKIAEFISELL